MKTKEALESFIYSCRARGLSPRTIGWYKGILRIFAARYNKLPKKRRDCEEFILSCRAGDERRHGYFRALRAFYNYAETRLKLRHNPMYLVVEPRIKPKLPRPLSPDQLVQLLTFPHLPRTKAILYFLADTGVRLGEILSLSPESILETSRGYIAAVTGKTGERYVPLSRETYGMIIKYLPLGCSRSRLSHLISWAFQDAHVPGSAINLRHTFGTLWKGDIDILRLIMGHSKLSTTMIYRKLQTEDISRAHNIYSPLRLVLPDLPNMI